MEKDNKASPPNPLLDRVQCHESAGKPRCAPGLVDVQRIRPMRANKPTAPFNPISAPTMTPGAADFPELPGFAAPAPVALLPALVLVAAVVLAAAAELVLAGTSSALRVPHAMQSCEPGFWIRQAAKRAWHSSESQVLA